MLNGAQIERFISENLLPDKVRITIDDHFLPLASWLNEVSGSKKLFFLGINGAPGTGKSTLSRFLKAVLESDGGHSVAILSLDDFYLTKKQRKELGAAVHPLLETRGVPGTHAVEELAGCLDDIQALGSGATIQLPRFDKARDDRAESVTTIVGPVDLVILEGWCVGTRAQNVQKLRQPVNELEQRDDHNGIWRRYVNEQLAGPYAALFKKLDALVFLQAPDFEAVYRWRLEQEQKLAASALQAGDGIMTSAQLARFIQHYERLTRANMACLPDHADVVLKFNGNHECVGRDFADGPVLPKN